MTQSNDSGLNLDHLEALRRLTKERDGWKDEAAHQKAKYERACESVEMLRDHERAHFWIWQGDGTDNLKSMTDGMTVLMRADHLRAALANQPAPTAPATREAIEEAAQVFEAAAAHNRSKGRTILAHSQQSRADRIRKELDGAPAHQPAQEQAEPLKGRIAKRLHDLAAGRITGDIKQIEYSLAADRIEELEKMVKYLRTANKSATTVHPRLVADLESKFGAAQQEPVAAPQQEKAPKPAHGHRDDYYLLANGRRLGLEPISRVRNMPNWVLAMELFATGSGSAYQICRDAGVDPECTTIQRAAELDGGQEGSD